MIPLLKECDFEKLGVSHVGERVMLMTLAKEQQSEFAIHSTVHSAIV